MPDAWDTESEGFYVTPAYTGAWRKIGKGMTPGGKPYILIEACEFIKSTHQFGPIRNDQFTQYDVDNFRMAGSFVRRDPNDQWPAQWSVSATSNPQLVQVAVNAINSAMGGFTTGTASSVFNNAADMATNEALISKPVKKKAPIPENKHSKKCVKCGYNTKKVEMIVACRNEYYWCSRCEP